MNECDVAAKIDARYNLSTYTNETCANATAISGNIETLRGYFKTIQQLFDPDYYAKNGRMQSVVTMRGENQLIKLLAIDKKVDVISDSISFF